MNAVVFDTHEASVSEEAEKNKPTDSGIVNKSVESMTFTPFVAGKKKKPSAKVIPEKPKMPAAKLDIKNTDMQSFFKAGKDSFVVTLEKVRYEIEKGSLDEAEKSVEIACKIAKAGDNSRNILEAQVLNNCLVVGDSVLKPSAALLEQIGSRKKVLFGLRPEACAPAFGDAMIKGRVDFVENTGNLQTATLRLPDGASMYVQDSHQDTSFAACAGVDFAWDKVCLFDEETGANLEQGGKQ